MPTGPIGLSLGPFSFCGMYAWREKGRVGLKGTGGRRGGGHFLLNAKANNTIGR